MINKSVLCVLVLFASSAQANSFSKCVDFLRHYVVHAEREGAALPLATAVIQPLKTHTLTSVRARDAFLRSESGYPWAQDLKALTAEHFKRHVVYLSEIGPTLWFQDELANYWRLSTSGVTFKAAQAREAIRSLAWDEAVGMFSEAARERVRNGMLAIEEGRKAEQEADEARARFQNGPPPSSGDAFMDQFRPPIDEALIDPETNQPFRPARPLQAGEERLVTWALFGMRGALQARQIEREMRNQAPSLRIPFESDNENLVRLVSKFRGEDMADFIKRHRMSVRSRSDALWVARTLARESLVRRKIVSTDEGVRTLATIVSEDDIFLFAAHPELTAFWQLRSSWQIEIRHHELCAKDPLALPEIRVGTECDRVSLLIRRKVGADQETVTTTLQMSTDNAVGTDRNYIGATERRRFDAWIKSEWAEYAGRFGLAEGPPPFELNRDRNAVVGEFESNHTARALGFYNYLIDKYGVTRP